MTAPEGPPADPADEPEHDAGEVAVPLEVDPADAAEQAVGVETDEDERR